MKPITDDFTLPNFYIYPKFLLKAKLSRHAKLAYILMLERTRLSARNGWKDIKGFVFIIYPQREMAQDMECGVTTVKCAMRELCAGGYIRRVKRGLGKADLLYVMTPEEDSAPSKQPCADNKAPSARVSSSRAEADETRGEKNAARGEVSHRSVDNSVDNPPAELCKTVEKSVDNVDKIPAVPSPRTENRPSDRRAAVSPSGGNPSLLTDGNPPPSNNNIKYNDSLNNKTGDNDSLSSLLFSCRKLRERIAMMIPPPDVSPRKRAAPL